MGEAAATLHHMGKVEETNARVSERRVSRRDMERYGRQEQQGTAMVSNPGGRAGRTDPATVTSRPDGRAGL